MSFASFWRQIVVELGKLDTSSWYLFVAACILSVWLVLYSFYHIVRAIAFGWLSPLTFILRHLIYPHVVPRLPFVGTATRLEALLTTSYVIANILIILIGAKTGIGSRAANMAVVNLIPLFCGPRLMLVTRLLGISARASIGFHQWVGRTAIVQALLHTTLSLTGTGLAWTATGVSGVVASSILGLVFLLSIGVMRSFFYDWFLNSHLLLSIATLIAIYSHIASKKPAEVFLQIGICLWSIATALHWTLFLFRNWAFGRPFARAVAVRLSNSDGANRDMLDPSVVLQVDISVPRPWDVKAGQSVYVSIPALGTLRGLRGHPFMISWWIRDHRGLIISLLVKSRGGFTAELDRNLHKPLRAFIDGPYGRSYDFGEYGTVIMFATGIGIASHMPYIKVESF